MAFNFLFTKTSTIHCRLRGHLRGAKLLRNHLHDLPIHDVNEADVAFLGIGRLDVVRTSIHRVIGLAVVSIEHIRHDSHLTGEASEDVRRVEAHFDHMPERERLGRDDRTVPVVLLGVLLPERNVLTVAVRDENEVRSLVPEFLVERADQVFPVLSRPSGDRGRTSDVVIARQVVYLDSWQIVSEGPLELQVARGGGGSVGGVAGRDVARHDHEVERRVVALDGLEDRLGLVGCEPVAPPAFGGVHHGEPEVVRLLHDFHWDALLALAVAEDEGRDDEDGRKNEATHFVLLASRADVIIC